MKRREVCSAERFIGLKGSKIYYDIDGLKVDLTAITLDDVTQTNVLGMLTDGMATRMRLELRDPSAVRAYIHDWEGPDAV